MRSIVFFHAYHRLWTSAHRAFLLCESEVELYQNNQKGGGLYPSKFLVDNDLYPIKITVNFDSGFSNNNQWNNAENLNHKIQRGIVNMSYSLEIHPVWKLN